MGGSKVMMSNESHHNPPHKDAKTVLLDVGNRRIDLERLANHFAALSTQSVVLEAAKMRP